MKLIPRTISEESLRDEVSRECIYFNEMKCRAMFIFPQNVAESIRIIQIKMWLNILKSDHVDMVVELRVCSIVERPLTRFYSVKLLARAKIRSIKSSSAPA